MTKTFQRKTASILLLLLLMSPYIIASESDLSEESELSEADFRLSLYKKTEALTHIPWYYIAAIDQYERNIGRLKDHESRLSRIQIPSEKWYGTLPPSIDYKHFEYLVHLFDGSGQDGDGDYIADHDNDEDVLYTMALLIRDGLFEHKDFESFVNAYYDNEKAANVVSLIAKTFNHFGTVDLNERAFPIPKFHNYTYRSTWGYARGWGGRRIHEGTDIFASYGVPVRSASYGIVEIKGWN